jgi:hypothetical protein
VRRAGFKLERALRISWRSTTKRAAAVIVSRATRIAGIRWSLSGACSGELDGRIIETRRVRVSRDCHTNAVGPDPTR